MEMLAANKMNLRRIFAAGWQEGESDAGDGDNGGGGHFSSFADDQSLAWADNKGGGQGENLG